MKLSTYLVSLLAVMALGLGVAACAEQVASEVTQPTATGTPWLNLDTMTECQYEDGTGVGQEYPCKWDARVQGNGMGNPGQPPITIYADPSECVMFELAPIEIRREIMCADVLYGTPLEPRPIRTATT